MNQEDNSNMNSNITNKSQINDKKLGRGIASLLAMDEIDFDINSLTNTNIANHNTNNNFNTICKLSVDEIIPNPNQPRKYFDNNKLKELSESIKNTGLLQPIVVTSIQDGANKGKYLIVAGERRYKASKLAGLTQIQAIILNIKEQEILKNAILENVQREDLNPIEEASGYKKIIDTFGYTHEQLAKEIGKSRAHITNLLRILTLPEEVQSAIRNDNISLGHAKVLLGVDNPNEYLPTIIEKQLSVRQLEKMIANNGIYEESEYNNKNQKTNNNQDENTANITFEMIKQLYSPLSQQDDTTKPNTEGNKLNTSIIHNKLAEPNDEEWQKVENNIKIIEQQLSDSCGFNVRLTLKPEGNGKIEIDFANAEDLLELVKMF